MADTATPANAGKTDQEKDSRDLEIERLRKELAALTPAENDGETDQEKEVYVHLANGDVHRVKESEVNGRVGGHFIRDGFAHFITAIWPVEEMTRTKGNN